MKDALVYRGPSRIQEVVRQAISWDSAIDAPPVQTQWSIHPKTTDIIDKHMRIRAYFRVKAVGGGNFKVGDYDCLRQMPHHAIINTMNIRINGTTISDTVSDKLHALLNYGNTAQDRVKAWSTSAAQPDQLQSYVKYTDEGSARNVMADYGENSAEISRGGFTSIYKVNDTTYDVVVTEPILMPPFCNGIGEVEQGFVNVNQMDINLLYNSKVERLWSHISGAPNPETVTGVTVSQFRAPELLYNVITPASSQFLPAMQIMPYSRLNTYAKPFTFNSLNEISNQLSEAFKLSIVPDCVYLFAKRSRAVESFETTDTFASIERIRVQFNNETLFSTSSTQELYDISRQNGLNRAYPQWAKYTGSVLCLKFGKDIGLPADLAPNVQAQGTIDFQVEFKNVSEDAVVNMEYFTIFQYGGVLSIAENSANITLGNLTKEIVLTSANAPHISSNHPMLQGGNFWSSLKNIVNKVAHVVAPVAGMAQVGLKAKGMKGLADIAGDVQSGAKLVSKYTGGGIVGGRVRRR
jgi:hypothetical protein